MISHACVPTALYLPKQDRIRVYFAPRNARGQSIPTYLEVDAGDPTRVIYLHDRPILALGERGTFDDGGIMPCSLVEAADGALYLYYVGWNPSVSVAYRNAVGLAISRDGGVTFERPFPGAVVDRNRTEPFFTASPCALREGDDWHLWYASSTGFLEVGERIEPLYVIKYAYSRDGIRWDRSNTTLLAPGGPARMYRPPQRGQGWRHLQNVVLLPRQLRLPGWHGRLPHRLRREPPGRSRMAADGQAGRYYLFRVRLGLDHADLPQRGGHPPRALPIL